MMPCAHGDAHTFDTNDANVHPCRCGLNKNKYPLVVHKSCHNHWTAVHRDSCVVCRTPTLVPQALTADIHVMDGNASVGGDARDSSTTNMLLRCCLEARR